MNRINAVILDWAGTTVDFGSFAPTQIFVEAFRQALPWRLRSKKRGADGSRQMAAY